MKLPQLRRRTPVALAGSVLASVILAATPACAFTHTDGVPDNTATVLSANNVTVQGGNMIDTSAVGQKIDPFGIDWAFSRTNSIPANDVLVASLCDAQRCVQLPVNNTSPSFSGTLTNFSGDPADGTFYYTFKLSGPTPSGGVIMGNKRIFIRW